MFWNVKAERLSSHRRQRAGRGIGLGRWVTLLLASLLVVSACAPQSPASAPTAPSKPAEASKPAQTEATKPAPAAAAKSAPAAASPAAGAAAAAKPKTEPKGSVTLVMPEEPPSLEIHMAYASYGYPVLRNVAEALLNRNAKNELVPELATKWEQTNPTTWRFTLRQGVKFHDESPFNAEAAAFSLNHSWSKENNFRIRQFVGPEMTAKAVDQYTLDVTTEAPDPILPSRLYFSPISSMKQLKESPDDFPLKPIGTGPYEFVEWIKGQHIKVTANPDWWGHGSPEAQGAVSIKDATFLLRAEREVRTAMVRRGEADLARWVTMDQCKEAPVCVSGPGIETVFLRMDVTNHAMKDKRVREAIALSVDKDAIINGIMGGGTVARQLVGPSALGHNPNLQPYPYDPARAKALIAEASAAGVPVDASITNYARRAYVVHLEEAAEAITEMMIQIGLPNAKTRVLETAAHAEIWGAPKPIPPDRGMIGTHVHGNEIMDYSATISTYYSCEGRLSVFCDPKIDEMHTKASVLTGEARNQAYQELAKYIHDQVYTVPIGHPNFNFAVSKRLDWKDRLDGFILLKEMSLNE